MRLSRILTVVGLVIAAALPATATEQPVAATLRAEREFFTCAEAAKVQNVAMAEGRLPTWSSTPPAQSVTAGGGCGYFENAAGAYAGPNRTTLDSEWQGTFAGNVDSLTVELHNIYAGAARATGPFIVRANLFVDGVEVFGADAADIRMTPVPSATRASEKMSFTFTGLQLLTEEGDGSQVRTYKLIIRSVNEEQSGWVWGATEVPAGVTFNPAAPEAVIVTVPQR